MRLGMVRWMVLVGKCLIGMSRPVGGLLSLTMGNTTDTRTATHLSGNDERNRLDAGPVNLVSPCDLTLCNVECAAGEETHPALGF